MSIESHRSFEIAFHLVFIGPLEQHPSLAFVFFTSLSLYQKILDIHVGLLKSAISVVLSRSLPPKYNTEYASEPSLPAASLSDGFVEPREILFYPIPASIFS